MSDVRIDNQLCARDRIRKTSTVLHRDQPVMIPMHDERRRSDGRELTRVRERTRPVLHVRDDCRVVRRMAEIGEAVDHRRI
eukprot:gene17679-21119_t